MSKGKKTTDPAAGGGDCPPGGTVPCPAPPKKVTVKIKLKVPVACPGHPFEINAEGDPPGGSYRWNVSSGTAQLVDGSGSATSAGDTVFLRNFQPDNVNGKIPTQKVTVQVTYTHPDGTATDTKEITIHGIDFVVTNATISKGATQANESAGSVTIGAAPGVPNMTTDPQIEIQLEGTCPRKTPCAQNHRVGWLQTMLTTDIRIRFRHTLLSWAPVDPMPIRDIITGAPTFPFYFWVQTFTADRDKQTAHHEDSPNTPAGWIDARAAAPAPPPPVNRQLRQVFFGDSFTAWLVVQNIEWSVHDVNNSFVFLRNFDWAVRLDVTVDTTQAVGSRCTPASRQATVPAGMQTGKGGGNPVLTAPFYNGSVASTTTAQPPI